MINSVWFTLVNSIGVNLIVTLVVQECPVVRGDSSGLSMMFCLRCWRLPLVLPARVKMESESPLPPPLTEPFWSTSVHHFRSGLCMSLKSCYPYFKISDFDTRDTWVMGLYDTCSYLSPQGREVSRGKQSKYANEFLAQHPTDDIKNNLISLWYVRFKNTSYQSIDLKTELIPVLYYKHNSYIGYMSGIWSVLQQHSPSRDTRGASQ